MAPATFNTINKWVAGVSDNFALGILNEAIGLKLPITVAPYAKSTLAAHPAFPQSLRALSRWGVVVLANEIIKSEVAQGEHTFNWSPVVEAVELGVRRPADAGARSLDDDASSGG